MLMLFVCVCVCGAVVVDYDVAVDCVVGVDGNVVAAIGGVTDDGDATTVRVYVYVVDVTCTGGVGDVTPDVYVATCVAIVADVATYVYGVADVGGAAAGVTVAATAAGVHDVYTTYGASVVMVVGVMLPVVPCGTFHHEGSLHM